MRIFIPLVIMLALPLTAAHATEYTAGPCDAPVAHAPANDVAYTPGVDAQGWAVQPAETAAPALTADDLQNVDIKLDLPLSSYADTAPYNADLSEARIDAGTLSVGQGDATLNDKILKNAESDAHGCPPKQQ